MIKLLFKISCFIIIILLFIIGYFYYDLICYESKSALLLKHSQEKPQFKLDLLLKHSQEIPQSYWLDKYTNFKIKPTYNVVYITHLGGEFSYAIYFKHAAENLGWKVKIYQEKIDSVDEILKFDPDFFILSEYCLPIEDIRLLTHRAKKYIIVMPPLQQYIDKKFKLSKSSMDNSDFIINPIDLKEFRLFLSADAILPSAPELEFYKKMFNYYGKEYHGFQLLPNAPQFSFQPAEPKTLMWLGMGWDKFRFSNNYQKFIKLLSDSIDMRVYGLYNKLDYIAKSYDGFIPPGIENIKTIRKNGIYLLTHADCHIKAGVPSLRLFEAVASNAVVISDLHPFAIKHFGDNFLYFNQNADATEMYNQVKSHVDWIKANPDKAKKLAAKANKIFLEKFNLEKDLINLAKMHEAIVSSQKKLSYSSLYN